MWGYLEFCGGAQYRGGYHECHGGYLEYPGVFSTVGDIMMHVGGYHEYRGRCSVLWGIPSLKFEYCGGYHDTCGGYHEYCGGVQYCGVLK